MRHDALRAVLRVTCCVNMPYVADADADVMPMR